DATAYPGPGAILELVSGELFVDRSRLNAAVGGANTLAAYAFRDIRHYQGGTIAFADGIAVHVPGNWKPSGPFRDRIFVRVLWFYGLEGETAATLPALGTATEGAGGGQVRVVATNPRTGTKAL